MYPCVACPAATGEEDTGGFSYRIIVMIIFPPHRDLQLCHPREGLSKLFRKDAVIVILPLIPRAAR